MRILTWNINGIRTLPQYHPWNTLKTHDDILNYLEADIICFQEMKSSRSALPKAVALPLSYDAFFSFPIRKSGYSGVATYTRVSSVVPVKAEEGLSGILQPKPPFTAQERVSEPTAYPPGLIPNGVEHEPSGEEPDYKDLDSEGRTLVLDFGLFVLINVYCPNDGSGTEGRDKYKTAFHRVLEARVKGLVETERREVIVVGDLNACAGVQDHCEGHIMVARGQAQGMVGEEGFWAKDTRSRLRDWLENEDGTGGCMIDIVRRLWPDRKGMYTCWNTKISARESNYGTRIDYILITRGLLPWVKDANIQANMKGSDHCPVFLDLHDEIADASGLTIRLGEAMGMTDASHSRRHPPRLASKFWEEYSGKQRLLDNFFGRKGNSPPPLDNTTARPSTVGLPQALATSLSKSIPPFPSQVPIVKPQPLIDIVSSVGSMSSGNTTPALTPQIPASQPYNSLPMSDQAETSASMSAKRKITVDSHGRPPSVKKQKQQMVQKSGQTKLSAFFAKPLVSGSSSQQKPKPTVIDIDNEHCEVDLDADHHFAILLSQEHNSSQPSNQNGKETTEIKQAWNDLLAPIQPPKCAVHDEPAKEMTVGKPGPNKGKKFFVCSRPVGPGYDKGRTERLREHVDPRWRCDFFKWSNDARRDMKKGGRT